jgi:hypothetical protein
MPSMREDFLREMRRFLPTDIVRETVGNPSFRDYLAGRDDVPRAACRRLTAGGRADSRVPDGVKVSGGPLTLRSGGM